MNLYSICILEKETINLLKFYHRKYFRSLKLLAINISILLKVGPK